MKGERVKLKTERLEVEVAEGGFLFGCHLSFGFGGFVGLAREVKKTVDDDTVQFVEERCTYLFGVGGNRVERYIDIAIHACARGIIKGDDVGIVVVLKELAIDSKDLLIVAEDIIEVAYGITILCCGTLDPLLDFADVNGRHGGVVGSEGNHGE